MAHERIYYNSTDFGSDSEDSLQFDRSNRQKSYVDPWDLENYAYIRGHLESLDSPISSSSSAFADVTSTSFYYAPAQFGRKDGNYAAIDEVQPKRYRHHQRSSKRNQFAEDESVYEENPMDSSSYYVSPQTKLRRKYSTSKQQTHQRPQQEIYNEEIVVYDAHPPIYDDIRTYKPQKRQNFSLTNYGHLKIDYSYSWNNLNKYIRN